jgi:hypothetical protein
MTQFSIEDQVIIDLDKFIAQFKNKNPFHTINVSRIKFFLNHTAEFHLKLGRIDIVKKNIQYHNAIDRKAVEILSQIRNIRPLAREEYDHYLLFFRKRRREEKWMADYSKNKRFLFLK